MSYPAGVVTRQVIVGPFLDASGDIIHGQVQWQLPFPMKWVADSTIISDNPETIFLDSNTGTGSANMPVIQDGFVNGMNNAVVGNFSILLTPILEPNSGSIIPAKYIQLGYGDGSPVIVNFFTETATNGAIIYTPGAKGDPGAPGAPGAPGDPGNLTIGTVTTLPPGSPATATITGGAPNKVLSLGIPKGDPGTNGSAQGLPTGGTAGQVLTKTDGIDYHTAWQDNAAQGIPAAGAAGQILAKIDGTDYNTYWIDVPVALPSGGNTGQYLKKNSNADGDAGWTDLPAIHNVPAGGASGAVLKKNSATDYDTAWVAPTTDYTSLPAGVAIIVGRIGGTGAWPNSGARPTARTDIYVIWAGADPDPAGMLSTDFRWRIAP